jgi:hypothetical protein
MQRHQDNLRYAKFKRDEGCTICVASMILVMLFLVVAIPCWFNGIQIVHQGTVVANHYSWNDGRRVGGKRAIHYYCTVKYNNNSVCERVVGVNENEDSGGMTLEKIQERTQNFCIMNSTKTVYTNYFTGRCELEYSYNSYNSSIVFFVFAGCFAITMCCTLLYVANEHLKVRRAEQEIVAYERMQQITPTQNPSTNIELLRSSTGYQIVPMQTEPCGKKTVTTFVENCGICFDSTYGTSIIVLPCGHNYHKKCIDKWFETSKTCPECRKNVGSEAINTLRGDVV